MSVYQALNAEWERISALPSAADHLAGWAGVEPALAGYRTPRQLVAAINTPGRAERAHELLRCLLRQAADPLAARSFMQAIVPALRAAKVWYPVEDHSAERVAAAWEAIRVHAGTSPEYPARFIVRVAERRLRTDREAHRRRVLRHTVFDPDRHHVAVELDQARPVAEQIAVQVIDAFRSGTLSAAHARLLYATAVVGLRPVDAGRIEGMPSRSVYRALAGAQAALLHLSA